MRKCPACGTELREDARFCDHCGVSQTADSPSTQPAQIKNSGSGAIGMSGSAAATTGGVAVRGDVHGNIYVGSPPKDQVEALAIYRRVLASSSGQLPLRGVDVGASDPTGGQEPLELANVYIDLDTTHQVELAKDEKQEKKKRERQASLALERETRPLGALEATIANRHMVLLGDPGGGKSTFVNHVTLDLWRN